MFLNITVEKRNLFKYLFLKLNLFSFAIILISCGIDKNSSDYSEQQEIKDLSFEHNHQEHERDETEKLFTNANKIFLENCPTISPQTAQDLCYALSKEEMSFDINKIMSFFEKKFHSIDECNYELRSLSNSFQWLITTEEQRQSFCQEITSSHVSSSEWLHQHTEERGQHGVMAGLISSFLNFLGYGHKSAHKFGGCNIKIKHTEDTPNAIIGIYLFIQFIGLDFIKNNDYFTFFITPLASSLAGNSNIYKIFRLFKYLSDHPMQALFAYQTLYDLISYGMDGNSYYISSLMSRDGSSLSTVSPYLIAAVFHIFYYLKGKCSHRHQCHGHGHSHCHDHRVPSS